MLSGITTKVESLHKVTTAAIDRRQVRNTILKDSEAMKIYKRRPGTPELCRVEVIDLGLVKMCKKCCSFTYRILNGGRTATHLKLRMSNREWTYQESIRHEMRSYGLKRTDLQGRNEEGDKGKGNSLGPAIMGVVGRIETGTMGVVEGAVEGTPTFAATPSPFKGLYKQGNMHMNKRETTTRSNADTYTYIYI